MHWNYRVLRHRTNEGNYYQLHEVYYNENGEPTSWTVNASSAYGESVDDLIENLELMLKDAKRSKGDVLEYGKHDQ